MRWNDNGEKEEADQGKQMVWHDYKKSNKIKIIEEIKTINAIVTKWKK